MDQMELPILTGKIRRPVSLHFHQGFTYIGVLVIMMVMLMVMGAASEVWHSVMQHEKEQQLLFVGHQFRSAIAKYYLKSGNKYPPSIDDLLESTNLGGKNVRFLRKLYLDPMTGNTQWGLVKGLDAKIIGVYSLSEEMPYKTTGFSDADAKFEGAEKYSDWKFVFMPKVFRPQTLSGAAVNPGVAVNPSVPANSAKNVNGLLLPFPRVR
jgi:type II secretory pathway pseudopilin PulG